MAGEAQNTCQVNAASEQYPGLFYKIPTPDNEEWINFIPR